ncbi:MAG: hypothetical protein JWQ58_586 [Reyranella sp.]|nr:hypothetical protein [Reyranella sp.]
MSRIAPPAESRINDWYAGASLADSFATTLPPAAPTDVDTLATLLFADPPVWFTILLAIRDRVMTLFGVKASHALIAGEHIAFFPVLSRSADEIVLGADDRHLDFRASLLLRRADNMLMATTVVRCHNLLGRLYLAAILPFHILVVTDALRRLRRRFQPS